MTDRSNTPVILGFDTSGPYCAAGLIRGDGTVATRFEEMAKGQAERLVGLLEELLADQGFAWTDLDALAVGIGPGNFTGIRIAVSAARGLALGLGIPVIAISNFEVLRGPNTVVDHASQRVTLPAPRGHSYVQNFRNGMAHGPAAMLSAPPTDMLRDEPNPKDIPETLVRIAAAKWHAGQVDGTRPKPLYIKPPDAAPARDHAPKVVG